MQQSSATPKYWDCGRLLHALTPPRSALLYLQFLVRWFNNNKEPRAITVIGTWMGMYNIVI